MQYSNWYKNILTYTSEICNGIETIKRLCPNSNVLKEFSTVGGIERNRVLFVMEGDKKIKAENQVKKWLNEVIYSKNRTF